MATCPPNGDQHLTCPPMATGQSNVPAAAWAVNSPSDSPAASTTWKFPAAPEEPRAPPFRARKVQSGRGDSSEFRLCLYFARGSNQEIALILEKFLSSDCGPLQLARKPIIFSGNSALPLRGYRNRPYRTNADYDFLYCPKIAIHKSRWRNT
jgi:hypothetical protein